MARLVIVRHGAAEPGHDGDALRRLTEQGLAQAEAAGGWLASHVSGAHIFSSPFIRAIETATAIERSAVGFIKELELLVPSGSPHGVADHLLSHDNVVVVSHLPLVGRLASLMTEGSVFDQPWSTAECWSLEGDLIAPGCMSVDKVWYPGLDG